jgi:uncharacterized membrane protein YidH (DUF202 family)
MERSDGYTFETQLERTVLSWNRSALAIGANGGLLAREGFERALPAVAGAGFVVVAVAAALWLISSSRYGREHYRRATHLIVHPGSPVLMLTAFVVLLSVIDLMLVATG